MPASRSRTEHWRRSLEKIAERNGAIEITLPRFFDKGDPSGAENDEAGRNLLWRVRVLRISESEIIVDHPSTMGHMIPMQDGVKLVGIMTVGQNRWMFHTRNIGRARLAINAKTEIPVLRLEAPQGVERCQRRAFYRISTAGLLLPKVECWPLLDPATVVPAETANRVRIQMLREKQILASIGTEEEPIVTPEVGPSFFGSLVNIGGGGVGLLVEPEDAKALNNSRYYWLGIGLQPHIPEPIRATAKLAHTHVDSEQRVYAGMAFEFDHNPEHRKFVVELLCHYVTELQREQLRRRAELLQQGEEPD